VLKIGYPHVEATWEAVGLEAAAGLAPEVYRQDAWTWSMLLEEVVPGTPMSGAPLTTDEALVAGAELLARLHARPAPPGIPTLADAMGAYAAQVGSRMPGQAAALDALDIRGLVDHAIADLVDLAATGLGTALLHGDFNPGNLLLDDRRGWLLIDPKPMRGDPAFDLWPLVSQLGTDIAHNLAVASDAAGVDPERAARWSFARTGINVSWYLAEGLRGRADSEAKALRAWARLLGA
jgi:streptomycin 6-kinase